MLGKIRIRTAWLLGASSLVVSACAVYDGSLLPPELAQGGAAGDATAGAQQSDGLGGGAGLVASGGSGTNAGGASGTPNVAGDDTTVAGDAGASESGGSAPSAGASRDRKSVV